MWWLPPPEFAHDRDAYLAALLCTLVPLLAGVAAGRGLQRWRARLRRRFAAVTALAALSPWPVAAWASRALRQLGVWDVLTVAALLSAGVVYGALVSARSRSRPWVHLAGALAVLAVCEEALGALGPLPVQMPEPRMAHLRLDPEAFSDPDCWLAFPSPRAFAQYPRSDPRRTVLHIGDSLVSTRYAVALRDETLGLSHVFAGVGGAGPDGYARALDAWLDARPATEVFVYVFLGNDLHSLGAPHDCCGDRPLFHEAADGLRASCPTPRRARSFETDLLRSPAPFAARVMARDSVLAARVVLAFGTLRRSVSARHQPMGIGALAFARFSAIVRYMRDRATARGARLHLVAVPYRCTVEQTLHLPTEPDHVWFGEAAGVRAHTRVVEIARAQGVDVVDLWDPVRDGVRELGVDDFFERYGPHDPHFGPAGVPRVVAAMKRAFTERGIDFAAR